MDSGETVGSLAASLGFSVPVPSVSSECSPQYTGPPAAADKGHRVEETHMQVVLKLRMCRETEIPTPSSRAEDLGVEGLGLTI